MIVPSPSAFDPGSPPTVRVDPRGSGRRTIAVSSDGSVRRWDLDQDSWLTTACRLVGRNLSQAEWTRYLGAEPYVEACPGAPILTEP